MSPCETDVLVVGGGPAGAAAALTLARYTRMRVTMVEASDYSAERVGETVSAALAPLLSYLGVPYPSADMRTSMSASEASWGSPTLTSHDAIFGGMGRSCSVRRSAFDEALADAAQDAGVVTMRNTRFRAVARFGSGDEVRWSIDYDRNGARSPMSAKTIIDATGRRAVVARLMGSAPVPTDRLVGVVAHAFPNRAHPAPPTILVEAVRNGWWYAAPLPGGRVVLAFMTDADLLRDAGRNPVQAFATAFGDTVHVRSRFGGAVPCSQPAVHLAGRRSLDRCIGRGWIAAGDAAATFDPLSSIGIGHALSSGIHAARVVAANMDGDGSLALAYDTDIAANRRSHDAEAARIYGAERRWEDQPFWQRRQAGSKNPHSINLV